MDVIRKYFWKHFSRAVQNIVTLFLESIWGPVTMSQKSTQNHLIVGIWPLDDVGGRVFTPEHSVFQNMWCFYHHNSSPRGVHHGVFYTTQTSRSNATAIYYGDRVWVVSLCYVIEFLAVDLNTFSLEIIHHRFEKKRAVEIPAQKPNTIFISLRKVLKLLIVVQVASE
ncbi:hypothetical protein PGUG_03359 [Meyerozyma guilliermondii ATCC 6260]|uniref:Uncharacterized protein n=1 Tax=Meyerozyma guilliermondii (strain ATCC 6260 / CBS 566 / DSM 6381 / JCM 1539 / NBRC 10279 / NRRL Y-324) TaxID=294746 RepID=A5DJA8_PICGU|nr:uncharacterized protein PGUG_03359 [Meyerozyma guilliermondii ATCC 6260]EDK39260.2 hypothetical protein PGUG_03359 [Meyerozyma guilliermondii ATCC 6260]